MYNTKYDIDLSANIGKLLPFYVRGRRMSLLLKAILHPIETLHEAWRSWAEERAIEASITSQKLSLAWYLNHKLRKHFINKNDSFVVNNGLDEPTNVIFTEREFLKSDEFSQHVYSEGESASTITMVLRCPQEVMEENIYFTIIPPEIEETSTYDNTDYRNEIARLVNKYNTSFKKYQIQV